MSDDDEDLDDLEDILDDDDEDEEDDLDDEDDEDDEDEEEPETLSHHHLETAEEAAQLWAELDENGLPRPPRASRRSSQRGKPKAVGKQAQRAKMILWGGTALLVLLVAAGASYKVPIVLYNMEYIDHPYIPPWSWIFEHKGRNRKGTTKKVTVHKTESGEVLSKDEIKDLEGISISAINDADNLIRDVRHAFEDNPDMSSADKEPLFEKLGEASTLIEDALATLEEKKGPKPVNDQIEKLNLRVESIAKLRRTYR